MGKVELALPRGIFKKLDRQVQGYTVKLLKAQSSKFLITRWLSLEPTARGICWVCSFGRLMVRRLERLERGLEKLARLERGVREVREVR